MGKTQLALLILYQLSQKGYDIYLADYKGVDFGPEYRKTGHYADDDAALEQMLDSVVHELNHRRTEFLSLAVQILRNMSRRPEKNCIESSLSWMKPR